MKKVVVASKNPVKLQVSKIGFKKMFPQEEFEFITVSVPSDVPDQPSSDVETLKGALNRANNAAKLIKEADFYVGMEGGVEFIKEAMTEEEMMTFAWVVIKSAERYGRARTGALFLPPAITKLVKAGKELGTADDIFFKRHNSKQGNGATGILTGDVITRTTHYIEALIFALIPFKNPDLY